jgi:hypothetical protein
MNNARFQAAIDVAGFAASVYCTTTARIVVRREVSACTERAMTQQTAATSAAFIVHRSFAQPKKSFKIVVRPTPCFRTLVHAAAEQ